MVEARLLIRVSGAELPLRVQALLDPGLPRPAESRFLVRRTHLIWIPALWLAALLLVGFASIRTAIEVWPDPAAGAGRLIYGSMAVICLFFAAVSAHRLTLGIAERSEAQRDRYREGLHLVALEGLLIAGRDEHTWVPRPLLPEPIEVTSRSGGGTVKSYAYVLADGNGRTERFDCGFSTKSTLWMWTDHGHLPQGGGWK